MFRSFSVGATENCGEGALPHKFAPMIATALAAAIIRDDTVILKDSKLYLLFFLNLGFHSLI